MKNELGFEILENANDKNIERLSEHKVLTQEEKKRILKMSIDKMNKRIYVHFFNGLTNYLFNFKFQF